MPFTRVNMAALLWVAESWVLHSLAERKFNENCSKGSGDMEHTGKCNLQNNDLTDR